MDAQKAIAAAARSGAINLTNWGLDEVPEGVFCCDKVGASACADFSSGGGWWEVVALQKLVLAHNRLTSVPGSLSMLEGLTLLDLSHNRIQQLPSALESLPLLKSLDVSHNKLVSFPPHLQLPAALVRLHCSHNALTTLPASLGQCLELAELNVANNRLISIPLQLAQCSRLTSLHLQENKLAAVDAQLFAQAVSLTELDLSKNNLQVIPQEVACLSRLMRLNLRFNQLAGLPVSLAGCGALAEVYLGNNRLERVPPSLGQLRALGTLELRDNQLRVVPVELCALKLQLLDVANNNLGALPPELGMMTSLRRLVLDGNPLRALRQDLVSGPTQNLLRSLRMKLPNAERDGVAGAARSGNVFGEDESKVAAAAALQVAAGACGGVLVLSSSNLDVVPDEVWEASDKLSKLDLSHNNITQFSSEKLKSCQQLRSLLLNDNRLCTWPLHQECLLPALEELSVARNPIKQLPPFGLGSVGAQLRLLDMTGVQGGPPFPINHLTGLEVLKLAHCQLTSVPAQVMELLKLRVLDLADNKIPTMPLAITALTNLEELNIANNDISTLPNEMGLMAPTLRSLMLEGNCLKTIRRPILERGTPAVLEYLKNRM